MNSTTDTQQHQAAPVALITGSGRDRVGQLIAEDLAERGYQIALHYYSSEDEAMATRDRFRTDGVSCQAYQADVGDEADVQAMFDQVRTDFGTLDVCVCTASIWGPKPLEEITADDLLANFKINTAGSFYCARAAGLMMADNSSGGSIILFGDSAINLPYVDHAAYLISKGSLPTLTQTLAIEFSRRNPKVRINCVHPGPILVPEGTSDEERQSLIEATLVKQVHCPEMVQLTVRFLIENSFLTGANIPLDGGRNLAPNQPFDRHQ